MSDGPIDSLSIEIGASSTKAVEDISKIIESLKGLKTDIKGLGTMSFGKKLGESMSVLAGSMKAIKSEDISKMRQVASALKTFDGVKEIGINSKFAQNMADIAAAIDLLKPEHFDGLAKFGSAMKNLDGVKTTGYDKLPTALQNIAGAVDSINDDSITRIHRLTLALGRLKGVDMRGLGSVMGGNKKTTAVATSKWEKSGKESAGGSKAVGIQMTTAQMTDEMWGALGPVSDTVKTITAPFIALKDAIRQTVEFTNSLSKTFHELKDAIGQTVEFTYSWAKNVSLIKQYWSDIASVITSKFAPELKLAVSIVGKLASSVFNVAKGIAKWAFHTAIKALNTVFGLMKNIAKAALNVAKKIPSAFAKMTKITGIPSLVNFMKSIQKTMSGFGRIAFYRAIRSAIKYVTDALKEGTENAYWYSKQFGDATQYISEAYDQMSSANFKMSNQLGAAWATLIAYIQPVIMQIISLVTKAAEVVTQFFAVLSGKGTYLKAIDYTKDWAEATDEGSKAAKEWKNQLLGFDEINRLEEPSDGGSRGKQDKYTDYGNMFEEAPVDGWLADLRKLLDSKDWENIGKLLGSKVNEWIDSVDWAGLGKKFGEKIQAVVTVGYNFLKTVDFKNLGSKLAEFLNNTLESIDFGQVGRFAMRLSTALWDILYGAVVGTNWKQLAIKLSDFIVGALNELSDWLSTLKPDKIAKAIKDFFGNIKYEEIRDSFVKTVKLAWQKAVELKDAIFDEETKEKVKNALKTFFEGLKWDEIKTTLLTKVTELWGVLTEKLDEIFPEERRQAVVEWIKGKLTEIVDSIDFAAIHNVLSYKLDEAFLGEKFANWSWSHKGDYAGKELIMGLMGGVEEEKPALEESLNANVNEPVDTTFQNCTAAYEEYLTGYNQFVSDVDVDNSTISSSTSTMGSTVATSLEGVRTATSETGTSFDTMSANSASAMSEMESHVNGASSRIQSALSAIREAASNAWSAISSAVQNANSFQYDYSADYDYGFSAAKQATQMNRYGAGGFPPEGQMFLAREDGPEMVGTIGGRTAVANNNDIVSAIEGGVYRAMASAMSAGGSSRSGSGVSININGREFMRAVWDDRNAVIAEHGVSLITNG